MKHFRYIIMTMLLGLFIAPAVADETEALKKRIEKLEKENSELKTDVQEIRKSSDRTYFETRRAEEVRGMVEEVLADAEARQSLASDGANAGWDKGFYLKSSDGRFSMNISGFIQARWIANVRQNPDPIEFDGDDLYGPGTQRFESGFQLARTRFRVDGTVFDPKIHYVFEISTGIDARSFTDDFEPFGVFSSARTGNGLGVYEASIGYDLIDEGDHALFVSVGQGNYIGAAGDISMEAQVHDTMQLAVDRSYNSALFGSLHATGIYVAYNYADLLKIQAHIADNGNTDFASATTLFDGFSDSISVDGNAYEFAVRFDIKLMGNWDQYDDFSSWAGEEAALFIGGGAAYVYGTSAYINGADLDADWTILSWAFDIRFEYNGFAVAVGIQGSHAHSYGGADDGSTILDFESATFDQYAALAQISYNINDTIEPFIRISGFFADRESESPASDDENGSFNITAGLNWFIYKHNLKATFDITYAIEEIESEASTLGFLQDGESEDGQIIIRAQVQLKY